MVIAPGFHLFPFRTEKLSPVAPMVLHTRGRVGSRLFSESNVVNAMLLSFFMLPEKRRLFPFLCLFALLTSFSPSGRRSEDRCRLRSVIYPLSIIHFPLNFVPLHLVINSQVSIINCQLSTYYYYASQQHNSSYRLR